MRVLIIIPTYNEIENIERLIKTLFSIIPEVNILVIDDNSRDGTGEYVEKLSHNDKRVNIIHRPKKLGLGTAYKLGFKHAIQKGYDYVFEMDADFSHNPEDVPRLLEKIKDCDLIIGSRYSDGVSVINWPMSRLLLSYFANIYAKIVTGVPIRDLTSGFKCYRLKVLKGIPLSQIHSDGYGFQIETVFWAYRRGFKVKEMSIIFTDRLQGTSKMSKNIVWEAFWIVWRLKIYSLLKH
ncbi:polyprenol monophosphomannose synthase [candidate division WOR-3 bacterium]|nr:polyprenol monophosphomannose synthase [candidate division WOR-3 bacterium]